MTLAPSRGCLPTGFAMSVTFGQGGSVWRGGWWLEIFVFSRSIGGMDGGRGRSCGRKGPSTRRRTDSCAVTRAPARSEPTPMCLVDHLRWLERECLTLDRVQLRDLERYMGILGAEVRMPLGEPWRVGKRPYGRCGTVDYGVVPERVLPASGGAGGQLRARHEPQPDSVAVAAGSPP